MIVYAPFSAHIQYYCLHEICKIKNLQMESSDLFYANANRLIKTGRWLYINCLNLFFASESFVIKFKTMNLVKACFMQEKIFADFNSNKNFLLMSESVLHDVAFLTKFGLKIKFELIKTTIGFSK